MKDYSERVTGLLYFPTGSEMAAIDAYTINEIGIPQMVLMEKASECLYEEIVRHIKKDDRCLVVVEGGNNGGDGVALARILCHKGYLADILYLEGISNVSDAFKQQLKIAENCGVKIYRADMLAAGEKLLMYNAVVDGIFGVGLKREVKGIQADAINILNAMDALKIAIDMPSGVSSDTGRILGTAFAADITITFGYKKLGMLYSPGSGLCGEIVIKDIGFPKQALEYVNPAIYSYTAKEINDMIPVRKQDSHKGSYGKVVVVAGSKNMAGACYFSAAAAYRTGCGLVRIYTDEVNREILQEKLPEAMLTTYNAEKYEDADIEKFKGVIEWADVIIMGPGLGTKKTAERIVETVMTNAKCPIVIDADAINILASHKTWFGGERDIIITPHLMEMTRFMGIKPDNEYPNPVSYVKNNMTVCANEIAEKYKVVCVLKDSHTVVASGKRETYINVTGNNGMSTGGSGDVLSGVIGGLLAQGMDRDSAAKAGVYIHGRAGDIAAENIGAHSMLAGDIVDSIATALGKIK